MWTYIVIGWIFCAIAFWVGLVIYWYRKLGISWKEYTSTWTRGPKEILKWILYLIDWPIVLLAVIVQAILMKLQVNNIIKHFELLDRD